jgi:cell wall-associated NlpC family hydrolase
MKTIFKILGLATLACTTLSATAQKRMASNDRAIKPTTEAPRFMENVVIENDNEVVNTTTTTKRNYRVVDNNIQTNNDDETTENIKTAKHDIQTGKTKGNVALYSFIDEWYGTPYKYGGASRQGIDCSAFVRELCAEVYGARLQRTSAAQFEETDYISSTDLLKEGDLVFFKIRSRNISHVGLYLGEGKFVHASRSKGIVISNLNDTYWNRYYVGGGKIK